MANINWYPGHMKKTRELIQENLKLVDVILELADARIPVSSRNPLLEEMVGGKARLLALNKSDLAHGGENQRWLEHFQQAGLKALETNSMSGTGVKRLLGALEDMQRDRNQRRNVKRPLRMMVAGVPNVGKSSLINRLSGRKGAQTGDRPGVTRGKQWLSLPNGMQLLDTPGILWPKLDDPKTGLGLALCGSIKDEVLDVQDLALELLAIMLRDYPENLENRYGALPQLGDSSPKEAAPAAMEHIALKRGYILPGKRIDWLRTAKSLLDEFRSGSMGRVTLEKAP